LILFFSALTGTVKILTQRPKMSPIHSITAENRGLIVINQNTAPSTKAGKKNRRKSPPPTYRASAGTVSSSTRLKMMSMGQYGRRVSLRSIFSMS